MNLVLRCFLCFFRAKQTFAATRPSAVLIEQLAVCVVKGEPVLLVGETGTGKTSTVQYLAHITGKSIVKTLTYMKTIKKTAKEKNPTG